MNRARGIATAFICASFAITGALTGTLGQAQAQGEGKGKGKAQEQSRFELLPGMTMMHDRKSLAAFGQAAPANWRIPEQAMAADQGQGFLVTKQSYADF